MPTPTEDIGELLDPILAIFRDKIQAILMGRAVTAYLNGSAQMVQWGRTILKDKPIFFEGPPMQQAINYANKHCAQLVTKMDIETKERLAKIIGDGIQNKRGVEGLARDIRTGIADMSKTRSVVISRTETADALEQSFMDRSKDMGVTGKEVITTAPCEICEDFEDQGVVAMNMEYIYDGANYGTRPPFHPRCRCALAPVML